jgi:hypothetical protein
MKHLAFPRTKRKHAQKPTPILFVTPDGLPRVSAPGRGGWRRPSTLEVALGLRSLRMASRFREGD